MVSSRGMKPAASRAGLVEAPVGRYLRGRAWAFGCPQPGLFTTLLAGRPDEEDLMALAHCYRLPAAKQPHDVLFDGSRLTVVDERAFGALLQHFLARARPLTRALRRVAFVHGGGVPGALMAGYARVLPLPCETRRFTDTAAALAFLDASDVVTAEVLALASSFSADAVLVRLQALLEERLGLGLEEAARALAVSPRSLQRRLQAADTSFQRELDRARMGVSIRRMLDSDAALTRIALEVGFASLQSFSDWFRGQTGETPSAFRSRVAADLTAGGSRGTRSARPR